MDEKKSIAWIGAGVMGRSMAAHLLNAGHELTVHSRTKSKAQGLLDRGARWAGSPAAAATAADVVISMVGFPDDVESVYLGSDGALNASLAPRLIIDMTTSRPSLALRLYKAAKAKGIGSVDAPVSGGDVGARQATLSIMAGGEKVHFDIALPILKLLGKNVVHHGGPGAGQHAKMVNQILIASNMVGVCEGLLYAAKAGLNPEAVIQSVSSGAAGSWSINNLGPRMVRRDFEPGFYVEHFIKDLGIALEEAAAMNLTLPGLSLARQLYEEARTQGYDRLGTQSLLMVMERLNGIGHAEP